jgi:hypothetical protein
MLGCEEELELSFYLAIDMNLLLLRSHLRPRDGGQLLLLVSNIGGGTSPEYLAFVFVTQHFSPNCTLTE